MARARNIKPGFCRNEDLAECSVWARLTFALLPMLADREGRLEDRPKRIKGDLFPFDSIEVAPLLDELHRCSLIARYVVDDVPLIQIMAFRKHQNPHHREMPSTLPPCPSLRLDPDGKYVQPEALGGLHEVKARGQPEARPRLDTPRSDLARGSSRADSLIPDSLIPLPPEEAVTVSDSGDPGTAAGKPAAQAEKAKRKTGTRLPDGWQLPKAWGDWAIETYPQWTVAKVRLEGEKFADHWHAKNGADAAKLDWLATWRNWCRSPIAHADDGKPQPGNGQSATVPSTAADATQEYLRKQFRPRTPEELERSETARKLAMASIGR